MQLTTKKYFDIFLGGTNSSNWRDAFIEHVKVINPRLKCFNPVVENWTSRNRLIEDMVKDSAKYHVYVITPSINGVYSIAEMMASSFEKRANTYICMLEEDKNSDGDIVKFDPEMERSLLATFDLAKSYGAIKCESINEMILKITDDFMNTPIIRTVSFEK